MKTYCFKLYKAKSNRKLHRQINAAGLIYNHCIALHKRSYRLYHKSLNVYALQKTSHKAQKDVPVLLFERNRFTGGAGHHAADGPCL